MLTTIEDFIDRLDKVDLNDNASILAFLEFADDLYDDLKLNYFIPDSRLERLEQGKEVRAGFGGEDMMPYLVGYVLASHHNQPPSEDRVLAAYEKLEAILILYNKEEEGEKAKEGEVKLKQRDSFGYTSNSFSACLHYVKQNAYTPDFDATLASEDYADVRRAVSLFSELKYEDDRFSIERDRNLTLLYNENALELQGELNKLATLYRDEAARAEKCIPFRYPQKVGSKVLQFSNIDVEKSPLQQYVEQMRAIADECQQMAQGEKPPHADDFADFETHQRAFRQYADKIGEQIKASSEASLNHATTCNTHHKDKSELAWIGVNLLKGIGDAFAKLAISMPGRFLPKPGFLRKAEEDLQINSGKAKPQKSKL